MTNPVDVASLFLQIVNLEMILKDFNNSDLMKNIKIIIYQNNEIKKLLEERGNMEELIEKIDAYIEKKGKQEFHTIDKDELFKVVDIYKDLKEVKNMNGYGNEYNRGYGYNGYNEYNRRGVDAKYRASSYMDGMRGSYEAYEDDRNEFNAGGNYGAKEDGLKDLDAMLHYNYKLIKYIKETATSPEEQEIVRKHFSKAKELMNV